MWKVFESGDDDSIFAYRLRRGQEKHKTLPVYFEIFGNACD